MRALVVASLVLPLTFASAELRGQSGSAVPSGLGLTILAHEARVRTAAGAQVPPERAVAQFGLELTVPTPVHALRLAGRILRSTRGTEDLHSTDAGVLLAGRIITFEAAFVRRGSYSPQTGGAHNQVAEFARAGLRARVAVGNTGFAMHVRGNHYIPTQRAADAADAAEGWEAESGVSYSVRRLPLTGMLGYRIERFRVFGVEQEVSSLTFALGVHVLGR